MGKPYDIAGKFNDYFPRYYKVHLQILCKCMRHGPG